MAQGDAAPIIIKRKKGGGGDGHHGGAWKVAYADFVTAMMAFFLLMWLLNATSEEQRQGLADYFAPTIPIHSAFGGGDGPFGGRSLFMEDERIQDGRGASQDYPTEDNQARGDTGSAPVENTTPFDQSDVEVIEDLLTARAGESSVADEMLQHIHTRVTDEGLIIEVFALEDVPLFYALSAAPMPRMEELMDLIGSVLVLVSNDLAINSHTPDGIDPWHLSSARGHSAHRMLRNTGVPAARFARLTGQADQEPYTDNPDDSRNNRIVVTVLRSDNGL